jgi:hypothetical protein
MFELNEWEDNGVFEEGSEDTRPAWAKRIQGYHSNWEQIDRILSVVGEVADDANVSIKTRPVRIGDRSYVVDVYLEGVHAGTYSY